MSAPLKSVSAVSSGRKVTSEELYRFDQNIDLCLDIPDKLARKATVEFYKDGDKAISHPVPLVNGKVRIPNELLKDKRAIHCYITVKGAPAYQTLAEITIPVRDRIYSEGLEEEIGG